jgi:flagellar hook-basal body complex protein FliE
MAMNISLRTSPPLAATTATPAATAERGGSLGAGFANALGEAIGNVESAQSLANSAASELLVGGKGDVHTVALAAQNAELSLELFQQVRNKFVSAYQEIMRMPM